MVVGAQCQLLRRLGWGSRPFTAQQACRHADLRLLAPLPCSAPGVIVPALPEKNVVEKYKARAAGVGGDERHQFSDCVARQRFARSLMQDSRGDEAAEDVSPPSLHPSPADDH